MADSLFNPTSLFQMLQQTGTMPRWSKTVPYSGDAAGEYIPLTNQLIAPEVSDSSSKNTLSHEMSHAVDANTLAPTADKIAYKIWNGEDVTDEEKQFYDTYKKVFGAQVGPVGMYNKEEAVRNKTALENMLPKRSNDPYYQYRTTPLESTAWGIGNMSVKGNQFNAIPHLDPTRATEFSILMDMFKKLPKDTTEKAIDTRKQRVEKGRSEEKHYQKLYDKFVDLFADPFAPTIK